MATSEWSAEHRAIHEWAIRILDGYAVDTTRYDISVIVTNVPAKRARVEATQRGSHRMIVIDPVFFGAASTEAMLPVRPVMCTKEERYD